MEPSKLLYDYKEICKIVPETIAKKIVSKGENNVEKGKYRDISVSKNSRDWLWRAFIKLIMPFQLKSTRDGKRKVSFIGTVYSTFFIIIIGAFVYFDWMKYLMVLVWIMVILKTVMPYVKALMKLYLNKSYYKTVLGGIVG